MKSLIISVTLFLLVALCIIINVGYIHSTADKIEKAAVGLAEPTEEKISALEELWKKNEGILGLSLSSTFLENVSKTVVSLRCAHESGDAAEYEKNRAFLFHCAEGIRGLERLSIENIF